MERTWSARPVHDGYGTAGWWTVCHIWICITTTRPLFYANEVRQTQRGGLMKIRSNCQTRQCWSNMKQDSVTALPVSHFKCYFNALLPETWESLWPLHHLENIWAKIKHCPLAETWGVLLDLTLPRSAFLMMQFCCFSLWKVTHHCFRYRALFFHILDMKSYTSDKKIYIYSATFIILVSWTLKDRNFRLQNETSKRTIIKTLMP